MVVKRRALGEEVVGADDGGVAASVAAADPAFLEHCNVGEPMLARQVVRGAEPMAAPADDQYVVGGLRLGVAPLRPPAALTGETAAQQRQARKALHPSDPAKAGAGIILRTSRARRAPARPVV